MFSMFKPKVYSIYENINVKFNYDVLYFYLHF